MIRRKLFSILLLLSFLVFLFMPVSVHATTDVIGGNSYNSGGNQGAIYMNQITTSSSGVLVTIGINAEAIGGNGTVGIYSTWSGGTLSGLLAQSGNNVLVLGWNDMSVSAVQISPATTYYLVWEVSASATHEYYTDSGTTYYGSYSYSSLPSSVALASPWTPVTFNMRITYHGVTGVVTTLYSWATTATVTYTSAS